MTASQQRAGRVPEQSISLEELQLATRNHGLPLEALRHRVGVTVR